MQLLQALLVLCCLGTLNAAKILAFFTIPSHSHALLGRVYLQALAARGHHITIVTPFKSDSPPENWREVIVPNTLHTMGSGAVSPFELSLDNPFIGYYFITKLGMHVCEFLLKDSKIHQLYNSKEKFDAIVIDDFCQDCFQVFAHKFNVPMVHVVPFEGSTFLGDKMGNPAELAYAPDPLLACTDHMNFFERVYNVIVSTWGKILKEFYSFPAIEAVMRRELNDSTLPSLSSITKKTSLLLINTHVSIAHPKPLVPNMVHVGGMHIKPPEKLPQDLQKYIDGAKDGVIYFSMGSNLKSADMPEEKRAVFLRTFSNLKQKVMWKWETDSLPNKPTNVMVSKWLPQSDILAHKNVKLFITHGGLHSTFEAVQRGVPLIAIPVFGDQNVNANRAVKAGYALKLEFSNVTDESLQWAIKEILDNPSYKEKVQQLSHLFQDRPRPPIEEAVYWTEYVIRHDGAPHMRSAALDLTWYQYLLLDIIGVVLVAVVAVVVVIFLLIRTVWRSTYGKSTKASVSANKKSKKRD